MDVNIETNRAGISVQTSVEEVIATTGGHGEVKSPQRVASGHTSTLVEAGQGRCTATAINLSVPQVNLVQPIKTEVECESCGTALVPPVQPAVPKAVNDFSLQGESQAVACAEATGMSISPIPQVKVEPVTPKGKQIAAKPDVQTSDKKKDKFDVSGATKLRDGKYSVEESSAYKRPRSSKTEAPASKRPCNQNKTADRIENEARKDDDLIVALIDKSNFSGKISPSQWQLVETKLVDALLQSMAKPDSIPARFDDAGWQTGVKLIGCGDDHAMKWLSTTVAAMDAPWPDAKLEVVNKKWIPPLLKAKLTLPRVMPREQAMDLLKWQNPDIPTADWQVVTVKPDSKGQKMVLKITKESNELLLARHGKMAWGMSTVRVHVKKRHREKNAAAAADVKQDSTPKTAQGQGAGNAAVTENLKNKSVEDQDMPELPDSSVAATTLVQQT
ncbi:uncharacterized protein [Drosophila virilis]|uniref:DUF4780 domain-containing protein n=1 Tax=Drosophila virilis TaxID=7244 RepID=B4LSB9_DROVI|nr:uncharacterized protein LOC6628967 [Drosophila virilis]EDW63727.1 uncharacterized protein Dvir_GJ16316 [Drosophila virilis]